MLHSVQMVDNWTLLYLEALWWLDLMRHFHGCIERRGRLVGGRLVPLLRLKPQQYCPDSLGETEQGYQQNDANELNRGNNDDGRGCLLNVFISNRLSIAIALHSEDKSNFDDVRLSTRLHAN